MTMQAPGIRGERYFRSVLESIAGGLEGRDTTLYQTHTSDRWRQSTTPGEWSQHLEFWVDLGGTVSLRAGRFHHSGRLMYASRYRADEDSRGQGRLHATIRDSMEYLIGTPFAHDSRVTDLSDAQVEGPVGDMLQVTIPFTLTLTR